MQLIKLYDLSVDRFVFVVLRRRMVIRKNIFCIILSQVNTIDKVVRPTFQFNFCVFCRCILRMVIRVCILFCVMSCSNEGICLSWGKGRVLCDLCDVWPLLLALPLPVKPSMLTYVLLKIAGVMYTLYNKTLNHSVSYWHYLCQSN